MRETGKRCGAALAALALCFALPAGAARAASIMEPTEGIAVPAQAIGVLPEKQRDLPAAASFSVTLPAEFVPDETPGRYIGRRWPLDAANITVEVTALEAEKKYTNAEKRAMEARGEKARHVLRDYTSLTAAVFEEAANAAAEDELTLKVTSFVNTTTKRASDGASFPGFRIRAELTGGLKPITEEIHIVLSDDKIFTVTYAQASDDEFDDLFRKSAATIAVY